MKNLIAFPLQGGSDDDDDKDDVHTSCTRI